MAVHIVAGSGAKEHCGPSEVFGLAPASGRDAFKNFAVAVDVFAYLGGVVGDMYPGAIAFTLIRSFAHSLAIALVNCATPPFAAA